MMNTNQSKIIQVKLSKGKKIAKKRKNVVIVQCPTITVDRFQKKELKTVAEEKKLKHRKKTNEIEVDFLDASREVHELGSTQFTGFQLKLHKESEYKDKTGRTKKRQKIPLKILRGMKAKQAKRTKKTEIEAKEAGIVMATKKKEKKIGYSERNRRDAKLHGPSPSIGFMKGGIYTFKK